MSKRKMQQLAAKAAGYELDCTIRPDGEPFYHSGREAWALANGGWFAPLKSSEDAFALMVKLGLKVEILVDFRTYVHGIDGTVAADHKGDPQAATRRAITLSAAEFGKNMP